MATERARKKIVATAREQKKNRAWVFMMLKQTGRDGVSLGDSDKSQATGRAWPVKTDTAVLIPTKDNET